MIDFIFALIAISAVANPSVSQEGQKAQASASVGSSVVIGEGVTIGAGTIIEGKPASAAGDLVAEPQTPTGKFTTATEVKPILNATKANWVALRGYGGNDLVYVTHLWAWRCGLSAMALSINDGPMKDMPLPDCHMEHASPNAILEEDGLPYLTFEQGSVERVTVQITYDDLSQDTATFNSDQIRIP